MESTYPRKRRRRSGLPLLMAAAVLAGAAALWACAADSGRAPAARGETADISVSASAEPGDTTPPVIQGVRDFTVYAGETVSCRSGVTVTDDCDLNPVLEVDTSELNPDVPGCYEIIYTATDSAGNVSRVAALVTVLERPENYIAPDTIDAAADKLLAEILSDGMTVREQVQAIYAWARTNISYGGHSDRTDYRQTAGHVLNGRSGDCFGYFAVTKLLFERLGIPNIDVRKVKNFDGDSDHFWSLVSVDGGKTYYHFDATPRVGDGDDFCLVTDAFLDAYSDSHKGSHNRDKSLYPATPEV